MDWIKANIFRFWENRKARNWGLTIGFLLVVTIGGRFASLAWRYGGAFDQVAVVLAGGMIGVISTVVLLRIWLIPPMQTLPSEEPRVVPIVRHTPAGPEFVAASELAHRRGARIRRLARDAAALGPVKRAPF